MTTTVRFIAAFNGKSPGDTAALADAVATAYIAGGLARLASEDDNSASIYERNLLVTTAGKLPTVAGDFEDDTAAEAGGVAVGQMYHTAGAVKVRVA